MVGGSNPLAPIGNGLLTLAVSPSWDRALPRRSAPRLAREPDDSTLYRTVDGEPFSLNRLTQLVRGDVVASGGQKQGPIAETFFASLKIESIHRVALPTVEHARRVVSRYVEVFYNRRRRHGALDLTRFGKPQARLGRAASLER